MWICKLGNNFLPRVPFSMFPAMRFLVRPESLRADEADTLPRWAMFTNADGRLCFEPSR